MITVIGYLAVFFILGYITAALVILTAIGGEEFSSPVKGLRSGIVCLVIWSVLLYSWYSFIVSLPFTYTGG